MIFAAWRSIFLYRVTIIIVAKCLQTNSILAALRVLDTHSPNNILSHLTITMDDDIVRLPYDPSCLPLTKTKEYYYAGYIKCSSWYWIKLCVKLNKIMLLSVTQDMTSAVFSIKHRKINYSRCCMRAFTSKSFRNWTSHFMLKKKWQKIISKIKEEERTPLSRKKWPINCISIERLLALILAKNPIIALKCMKP